MVDVFELCFAFYLLLFCFIESKIKQSMGVTNEDLELKELKSFFFFNKKIKKEITHILLCTVHICKK